MGRPVPRTDEFIGKTQIVKRLLEQLEGARSLVPPQPMPHTLLTGIPGTGKSLLIYVLTRTAGANLSTFYPQKGIAGFNKALLALEPHDFLAVDEAHMLSPKQQYRLLDVLSESALRPDENTPDDIPRDETGRIRIHPSTIIFCTNYPELLMNDLLGRIQIVETISYYTVAELREIVRNYASECGLLATPQAITLIAKAASGIPREAKHLTSTLQRHLMYRAVRDKCAGPNLDPVTSIQVRRFFRAYGIHLVQDRHDARLWCRLRAAELQYLKYLTTQDYRSLTDMIKLTGISRKRLELHVERVLVRCGLLEIHSKGRAITRDGRACLQRLSSKQPDPMNKSSKH